MENKSFIFIFGTQFFRGRTVGLLAIQSHPGAYTNSPAADSGQSDIRWVFLCKKHGAAT
jgi:hypothetical protein